MKSVFVKDEAHEERVEANQALIERHNIAMSRMVDATIAVMRAHAIPVFNETQEELFDGFHRRFSSYVSAAARFLDEYLESYEFEYVEQKSEKPIVKNPASPGFPGGEAA